MDAKELLEKYAQGERDFQGVELKGVNLNGANLSEINLKDADLTGAKLDGVNLTYAVLKNANLSASDLDKAKLMNANLESANLSQAYLRNTDFTGACLNEANFSQADFSNHKVNFQDAELYKVKLYKAQLQNCDLTNVIFNNANFSRANLEKAKLREASLEKCNFKHANLKEADLIGANVDGASFIGADLTYANLYRANIEQAEILGAIMPDGKIYEPDNYKIIVRTPGTQQQKVIHTDKAPEPPNSRNQAVIVNGMIFVAGQIGIDPRLNSILHEEDVGKQTEQIMANLEIILTEAGSTWADVVKTTIFLKNMSDFAAMNAIYANYFDAEIAPICACVAVSQLPQNALVQIECVALSR
ncbi:Rid family detoxifying hydrolase [Capilliphycus salinus ALCB114379]|uniref:Rid family detoxifying hydrolase n=1 Tax=Capilliphycus salinus TaxID=2768948 RepID=UPI0039A4CA9B